MNINKEIHDLLIKEKIPVPESAERSIYYQGVYSETINDTDHRFYLAPDNEHCTYPTYSTDELFRILPYQIVINNIRYQLSIEKDVDGTAITSYFNCDYGELEDENFVDIELSQALKELLKWVIENYPEQLREHLEKV